MLTLSKEGILRCCHHQHRHPAFPRAPFRRGHSATGGEQGGCALELSCCLLDYMDTQFTRSKARELIVVTVRCQEQKRCHSLYLMYSREPSHSVIALFSMDLFIYQNGKRIFLCFTVHRILEKASGKSKSSRWSEKFRGLWKF